MNRRICGACSAGLLVLAIGPWAASAAGTWNAPVEGCEVLTPYAAVYNGATHRGVDLAAEVGAAVVAPAGGTISFAGRVPADGGGTCGAVTIEFPDGLKATLLPLAEVWVAAGDPVLAGEGVGAVAASGDSSAGRPHLHVGLRRGDAYLDPTGMLPAAALLAPEPVEPIELPARSGGGQAGLPPGSTAVAPGSAPAATASASVTPRPTANPVRAAHPAVVPSAVPVSVGAAAVVVRHPVPQGAGAPAPSQIVHPGTVRSRIAEWSSAIVPVADARPVPLALIAPGISFVLVGACGLGRQLAHSRVS